MTAEAQRLTEQLSTLDASDRREIVAFLNSIDDGSDRDVVEYDPAFEAEIERRTQDRLAGRTTAIPAEELHAQLRARYK